VFLSMKMLFAELTINTVASPVLLRVLLLFQFCVSQKVVQFAELKYALVGCAFTLLEKSVRTGVTLTYCERERKSKN
jgi:hypothetical protein